MSQNGTAEKQNIEEIQELSIQRRAEENQNVGSMGGSFFFHRVAGLEDIIAPWWSERRDKDLREFWLKPGNDILQGAVASMVKKIKATGWTVEGGSRVVTRYQKLLAEAEYGQGWGILLGKTLIDWLTQDKGGFWELIGEGDPAGSIVGPVLGIAHLDSGLCQLTGDPTFPVLFWDMKDDKRDIAHKLHRSRVAHLVDMPSPRQEMLNVGFCSISRVISSSQVLLKLQQYKNEKLSDLPPAGILALSNVLPSQWEDIRQDYKQDNRKLNQEIWRNVMVLLSMDPATPINVEFTSFADLPEHFNELESTNIFINILALAFGVDVREFWPLSGGSLGTATESEVMHQKAKGKGPGEIYSSFERVINWRVFPPTATFSFDYTDDDEDLQRANINKIKTDTIISMYNSKTPSGSEVTELPLATRLEARQMLADNVPDYFSEEFLEIDIVDEEIVTDVDREKMIGKTIKINQDGIISKPREKQANIKPSSVLELAEKNYRAGLIPIETVIELRKGELEDDK